MKPHYKHDCSSCTWLGSVTYPAPLYYEDVRGLQFRMSNADLYFCKADEGTVIARFSSQGSDYSSSPLFCFPKEPAPDMQGRKGYSTSGPALQTAYLYAQVKGLIP